MSQHSPVFNRLSGSGAGMTEFYFIKLSNNRLNNFLELRLHLFQFIEMNQNESKRFCFTPTSPKAEFLGAKH